jgi:hypothetical protein
VNDLLIVPEIERSARVALVALLWELASDLGRLRRSGASVWILDEAIPRVDVCLNIVLPSAGELCAAGMDPETAVEIALARGDRLRRLVGEEVDA